jgi:hypothetical protein
MRPGANGRRRLVVFLAADQVDQPRKAVPVRMALAAAGAHREVGLFLGALPLGHRHAQAGLDVRQAR